MAWVYGNRYLSESEKKQNVQECESVFKSAGWSVNARAAMYGNMDYESNINPAIYENLKVNIQGGYGLTQWTPASKVQNWLRQNSYDITSGYGECQRILWELRNNQQWIPTVKYPVSFKDFTTSDQSLSDLVEMWCRNYERPNMSKANLPERLKRGNKWLAYIGNGEELPEPPEPENPVFPPENSNINQSRNRRMVIFIGKYWKRR